MMALLRSGRSRGAWLSFAVADVVADDALSAVVVARGDVDGGEVEAGSVVVGCGEERGLSGSASLLKGAVGDGPSGDQVGDVDDGAGHVVVEAVAFEEPGPSAVAEVIERWPRDEGEGTGEVSVAGLSTSGLGPYAEPPEEVDIDQDIDHLVDADPAVAGCG